MKRWNRSIPCLLAPQLVLIVCAAALSLFPAAQQLIYGLTLALLTIALYGGMAYQFRRDTEAADAMICALCLSMGTVALGSELVLSRLPQGMSSRDVLLVHLTLSAVVFAGMAMLLDAVKGVPPKQWWATFQAWQRGTATPWGKARAIKLARLAAQAGG